MIAALLQGGPITPLDRLLDAVIFVTCVPLLALIGWLFKTWRDSR